MENCLTAWAGKFAGYSGSPTIILEAVVDYDLWILHAYCGMPDTNNDINVLESFHFFSNLAQSIVPPAHYLIQRKQYNMGYYLADGIYLNGPLYCKLFMNQEVQKKKNLLHNNKHVENM